MVFSCLSAYLLSAYFFIGYIFIAAILDWVIMYRLDLADKALP